MVGEATAVRGAVVGYVMDSTGRRLSRMRRQQELRWSRKRVELGNGARVTMLERNLGIEERWNAGESYVSVARWAGCSATQVAAVRRTMKRAREYEDLPERVIE